MLKPSRFAGDLPKWRHREIALKVNMTSKRKGQEQFDAQVRQWDAAMKNGDMDKALGYAAKALQIAVSGKEYALQKAASVYVETTLAQSTSASGKVAKVECSFCGRNRDQARLLVGADGKICEYCAERASRFFAGGASSFPSKKNRRRPGSKRNKRGQTADRS